MTTTVAERWLPIPDYESLYQVSDWGRVRSFHRKGRILKSTNKGGYPAVVLQFQKRKRQAYVHELVLEAFVGPRPDGYETRHLNGKRDDNRLHNLRWGTQLENAQDKQLHGTMYKGEKHHLAKLSDKERNALVDMYRQGVTIAELAAQHHVSYQTVWSYVHA